MLGQTYKLADLPFSFHRMDAKLLVVHVQTAVLNARAGLSRILADPLVLQLKGMSDARVRHLLNNIMSAPGRWPLALLGSALTL